jgi:hypothetical protein
MQWAYHNSGVSPSAWPRSRNQRMVGEPMSAAPTVTRMVKDKSIWETKGRSESAEILLGCFLGHMGFVIFAAIPFRYPPECDAASISLRIVRNAAQ